jgi:hypothetical protein
VSAGLSATVDGAAVTDIDDHDAGLIVLHAVDNPPRADSDPEEPAAARQGFDLSGCRIVGEIAESRANAVADYRVKGCVLLAGTPGQLDLVRGHLLSALRQLSVHVGKPVGTPVVGVPLG